MKLSTQQLALLQKSESVKIPEENTFKKAQAEKASDMLRNSSKTIIKKKKKKTLTQWTGQMNLCNHL